MANRRMFSKEIVRSDAFINMPISAQCLYYQVCMDADDDGFVNGVNGTVRYVGLSTADLVELVRMGFLIIFENGVVLVKHWRINNYIQKDRYHETNYDEEKTLVDVKKNGAYTIVSDDLREHQGKYVDMYTDGDDPCIQTMYTYPVYRQCIQPMYTDHVSGDCIQPMYPDPVHVGKYRLDKSSVDKNSQENISCASSNNIYGDPDGYYDDTESRRKAELKQREKDAEELFEKLWSLYPRKKGKGQVSKKAKLNALSIGYDGFAAMIERFKKDMDGKDEQFIPHGSTFFNSGYVDYLETVEPSEEEPPQNIDRAERYREIPDYVWECISRFAHSEDEFDWTGYRECEAEFPQKVRNWIALNDF